MSCSQFCFNCSNIENIRENWLLALVFIAQAAIKNIVTSVFSGTGYQHHPATFVNVSAVPLPHDAQRIQPVPAQPDRSQPQGRVSDFCENVIRSGRHSLPIFRRHGGQGPCQSGNLYRVLAAARCHDRAIIFSNTAVRRPTERSRSPPVRLVLSPGF